MYNAIKFIYVVVSSIVIETAFLYIENDLLYCHQILRHQFSQAEEATSKISARLLAQSLFL